MTCELCGEEKATKVPVTIDYMKDLLRVHQALPDVDVSKNPSYRQLGACSRSRKPDWKPVLLNGCKHKVSAWIMDHLQ
jgi:hypothetical protein